MVAGQNMSRLRSWSPGFLVFFCCVFLWQRVGYSQVEVSVDEGFSAHVVKVLDGDTVEVMHQGKKVCVRLWGIDTPEWQQGFSSEAREVTRYRLQGREVELLAKAWDRYDRLVAVVTVDGRSLNEELLRAGLAWVHIYYCKEPVCREWRQLEKEARMAGRGLWQEDNPVPPWKWKQDHR